MSFFSVPTMHLGKDKQGCRKRICSFFSHSSCFLDPQHLSYYLNLFIRASFLPLLPMTLLYTATGKPVPSQPLLFPLVLLLFSIREYFFAKSFILGSYLPQEIDSDLISPSVTENMWHYGKWWVTQCFDYIWNKGKQNQPHQKTNPTPKIGKA